MNQRAAFEETFALIEDRFKHWTLSWERIRMLPPELQFEHLRVMHFMVMKDANPQGGEFSGEKLGRWLGWLQAAGTALGVLTLEECKEINKKWADGD